MDANGQQRALERIAEIIHDYRAGEIPQPDAKHVEKWISQFPLDDRGAIVAELETLFAYQYVRRADAETYIDDLLSAGKILGSDPERQMGTTCFVRLKEATRSQFHWLKMANATSFKKYGHGIRTELGQPSDTYVYLDDGVFTGRTFEKALYSSEFLDVVYPALRNHARLHVAHFGVHRRGKRRVARLLEQHAASLREWTVHEYANDQRLGDRYDCYWPREVRGLRLVDEYAAQLRRVRPNDEIFRPSWVPARDHTFAMPETREVVERAFLVAGLRLRSDRGDQPYWRPMGFDNYNTLGFGSVFFTYRNIANTCPLALWWGLGGWYPLLPRNPRPLRG